jgi:hypothetical protein
MAAELYGKFIQLQSSDDRLLQKVNEILKIRDTCNVGLGLIDSLIVGEHDGGVGND